MPSEGVKLAQAVTASEVYALILHLREDMQTIVDQLIGLPGELYPRKTAQDVSDFLSNKLTGVFQKLSNMAIRSGVSQAETEGAYLIKRKAILKDLLNRRVITKRRLNTCLIKCGDAFDNWAGQMVYNMFGTVWLATRGGLASITRLMHDYLVEEEEKKAQSQAQGQSTTSPQEEKQKWGKKKK